MSYGTALTLQVAIPGISNPENGVDFVTLIRCTSVTHHFNWDQRCLKFEITQRLSAPSRITLAALPTHAQNGHFMAPPGYYMLFLVRRPTSAFPGYPLVRVPSIAAFVKVNAPSLARTGLTTGQTTFNHTATTLSRRAMSVSVM